MAATFCPKCGTLASPTDKFCINCGYVLADAPANDADQADRLRTLFNSEPDAPMPTFQAAPVPNAAVPTRVRKRRKKSRARVIFGRLALAVVAIALIAGGYLAYRVWDTMSNLHEVSTPPPLVDSEALGGTPGTGVDSGPALTAIATHNAQKNSGQVQPQSTQPAEKSGSTGSLADEASVALRGPGAKTQGLARAQEATPAPPAAVEVPSSVQFFLLMGVDARSGEPIDVGVRPDSLAVAAYDSEAKTCRLLSIPRDTRVELPGYGLSKINHALAVGGIPYQQLVVEEYLGITIDHYALIDFSGVVTVIDEIGGVDVEVTDTFTVGEYSFAPGTVHMNGKQALTFARYRGGSDGDFGRIRRQQQVLSAAVDKLSSSSAPSMAQLVPSVMNSASDHVRTDLSINEITDLSTSILQNCGSSADEEALDGEVGTFHDPLLDMDLSYVSVDPAERDRKVHWLATGEPLDKKSATVQPVAVADRPGQRVARGRTVSPRRARASV